jgi:acyl dehydratase
MGSTVNYGAERLRFISPVPAGSMIHARQRLVHVSPKPKGTQITTETDIRVVGASRPAVLYQSIALLLPV